MKELLKSTDPATIAFVTAILQGEGIQVFEFDVNTSILEGSIGIFPRRLMVRDTDFLEAEAILSELERDAGNT